MKMLCLKGFVMGLSRFTGMIIFIPIAMIQLFVNDGLEPGNTYATYGLVMWTGMMTVTVFSFGIQAYAEFKSFMIRLGDVLLLEDFEQPDDSEKGLKEG